MATDYLPKKNADGQAIIEMTDAQKYVFDLRGWICLPALIDEDTCGDIRKHLNKIAEDPEQLPENERHMFAGVSEPLLDHPVIVGICNELISHQPVADEDHYGFRYDHGFLSIRQEGHENFSPHGGGGLLHFAGDSHMYQHQPGKVFAGLLRVVWELNEVRHGDGTLLLSGSHKTAFERPKDDVVCGRDSELWHTYSCPPGSVLIFTEALCHSGSTWTNSDWDRVSLFSCYNTMGCRWAKGRPSDAVLNAYKSKRQSLFRGVWTGAGEGESVNKFIAPDNVSL
ncbi:phytanoyl-CoA dioxygenase family protein [bacterium AH-315-E10]|nr:phytanoyl-CoA dioxygenase family protein [bacterium AH-315-E10]